LGLRVKHKEQKKPNESLAFFILCNFILIALPTTNNETI